MAEEEVYLTGLTPGLPGNHGPGWYLIDYVERTIRPKPIEVVDTSPELDTPSELQSDANTGQQEGEASGPEVPVRESDVPPDQAQQPMEVVAEPASSVPTEEQATQPEQE